VEAAATAGKAAQRPRKATRRADGAKRAQGREASARKIRDWEVAAMEVVAPPVWVGGGFR
jgi:hypothetical protein